MKEFLKIWLTLLGFVFGAVSVVAVGIILVSFSFFWGLFYFGVIATGIMALAIYHDIHKYD